MNDKIIEKEFEIWIPDTVSASRWENMLQSEQIKLLLDQRVLRVDLYWYANGVKKYTPIKLPCDLTEPHVFITEITSTDSGYVASVKIPHIFSDFYKACEDVSKKLVVWPLAIYSHIEGKGHIQKFYLRDFESLRCRTYGHIWRGVGSEIATDHFHFDNDD